MEAIEFSTRKVAFARDLDELVDDLAAAKEEQPPPDEVRKLVLLGEQKISEYEELVAQLKGGMRSELIFSYSGEVEELRAFVAELKEDSA